MSHLLPAVVLTVGGLCWMSTFNAAEAQNGSGFSSAGYPNGFSGSGQAGGYRNQSMSPNANFGGGQSSAGLNAAAEQPSFRTAARSGEDVAGGGIPAVAGGNTAVDSLGEETGEDQADPSKSWIQTPLIVKKILSGGWLMLPLGVCSLLVITLSFERLIALRRGRVIPRPFVRRFTECVEDGVLSYEEATELCKEFDCPVSEVFRAALRRWGRPMFEIEQAVMDAGDRVSDDLRKFLRVFHAISNVAPLIGLLGTVIGMIEAFEVISDGDSLGRPEMLAGGISMALMTTAGGLAVAIPAYLAYMYFSSKSDRYLGEIEKLCQRVIDCISAEGLETAGGGRTKKRKAA